MTWGRNLVARHLQDMGGHHFFNIKGSGTNVFWVPAEMFEITEEGPDLPKIERSTL